MRRLEWLGFCPAPIISICIIILISLLESFRSVPLVWYWTIMSLLAIGLVLFARSKLGSIKKGKFFTFGTKNMTEFERVLYKCSYVLMATGALLTLLFLIYILKV